MYTIETDYEKNRVYILFKGIVGLEDLEGYMEEIKEVFKKLKPNFGLILNILEVTLIEEEAREMLTNAMQLSKEAGIKHSIRVVPKTLPGEMKALLLDKASASVGYIARVVHSMEEAEKLLDTLEERDQEDA